MHVNVVTVYAQIYRTFGGAVGIVILVLQVMVIISVLAGSGSVSHKLLWTVIILLLPWLAWFCTCYLAAVPPIDRYSNELYLKRQSCGGYSLEEANELLGHIDAH